MEFLSIATIIGIFACTLGFGFFIHRLYQNRNKRIRSLLVKTLFAVLLDAAPNIIPIYSLMYGIKPRWLSIIEISAYPFAALIGYFIVCELLYTRIFSLIDIIKSRIFCIFICLISVTIGITCFSSINASFTQGYLFEKKVPYYFAYFFYYFCQIYVHTQTFLVFNKEVKREHKIDYKARIVALISGYISVLLFYMIAETNLFLSFFILDSHRLFINWIVQDIGKGLSFILLLIGFVFPQKFYIKVTKPLVWYIDRNKQKNLQLMNYYYDLLTTIVPRGILKYKYTHPDHVFMLIYDADKMIWSHVPSRPASPKKQAQYIAMLLRNNITVTKMGPSIHPMGKRDFLRHHLAIARHLHRMEGLNAHDCSPHEGSATPR